MARFGTIMLETLGAKLISHLVFWKKYNGSKSFPWQLKQISAVPVSGEPWCNYQYGSTVSEPEVFAIFQFRFGPEVKWNLCVRTCIICNAYLHVVAFQISYFQVSWLVRLLVDILNILNKLLFLSLRSSLSHN